MHYFVLLVAQLLYCPLLQLRKKLFILLADNPPRDLEPVDVEFLQSLPIYNTLDITALLPRSAQHATAATASATAAASSRVDAHLPDITVDGDGSSSSSGSSSAINGVNRSSNPASSPRVVALNERTDWLLVPAGVIADVAGELAAEMFGGLRVGMRLWTHQGLRPSHV